MRQLFPVFREDVDPLQVYEDPRRRQKADRPYVFVNMVSSVDGGTVVDGVTEQLGGAGDRHIFLLLRSLADGILAGAQTVRVEGYGPPKVRGEFVAARRGRGQEALPRLAIVSRSLDLDWGSSVFGDERTRPFVLAPTDANPERLGQAGAVADVITVGEGGVDLAAGLAQLRRHGVAALLCEGGPTLNGQLLKLGLIDELCLTLAPTLLGESGGERITGRAGQTTPAGLTLVSVLEEEGSLFLRYLAAA